MKTEEGKSMEKTAEEAGRKYAHELFPAGGVTAIAKTANHFEKGFIAGWQQCQQEGDKEISKLQESLLDVVTQSMKEIERLKGLIKKAYDLARHNVDNYHLSGEQDEEESYQVVLWEEAAMKLFKKYNPGMTLSEGIGNRIYLGFSKDMDFLREYYKITRTT